MPHLLDHALDRFNDSAGGHISFESALGCARFIRPLSVPVGAVSPSAAAALRMLDRGSAPLTRRLNDISHWIPGSHDHDRTDPALPIVTDESAWRKCKRCLVELRVGVTLSGRYHIGVGQGVNSVLTSGLNRH